MDGGVFSTYANEQLRAGDEIRVRPPEGRFHTPLSRDNAGNYMCICIGSGITPVLSIVKSILAREPQSFVTLLYGNRNSATVMFRNELSFLKNRYMTRFSWINILSREQQDAEVLYGRLDNRKGGELMRKRLIDIAAVDEFFLCGPQSMISEVSRGLRGTGVDEAHIHYELFSSSGGRCPRGGRKTPCARAAICWPGQRCHRNRGGPLIKVRPVHRRRKHPGRGLEKRRRFAFLLQGRRLRNLQGPVA